jgi:hypothetical protein
MRPAHLIDSSVSRTSRQELSARKNQLDEISLCLFCPHRLRDHEQSWARWFGSISPTKNISPAPCPFAKSSGERQKTLTDVKKIFPMLALAAMLSLASCGWFGSPEAYKSESGRTTFRAANESPSEHGEVTPASQKIPGESR